MRKSVMAAVCVIGVSSWYVTPAIAADLSNGASQSCSGTTTWHFVNNQTRGADPGTLTAQFTVDGDLSVYTVGAETINRSNQHFYVTTEGDAVLVDASTDLPGRLVLSDFACDGGPKDPPPKK